GRTVETVLIAHAGHGYFRRDHRRTVWGAMIAFLARQL
ncbi:MAG: S9 family peptidase, partial [Alphaproteobacteria bacterium]|nr:S9 family peptidase [Alphaproteobacteria bacterium]